MASFCYFYSSARSKSHAQYNAISNNGSMGLYSKPTSILLHSSKCHIGKIKLSYMLLQAIYVLQLHSNIPGFVGTYSGFCEDISEYF